MLHQFPFYLFLVVGICLLIMLSRKIRVAYPVLLVIAGLSMSFLPSVPRLKIDPELIFVLFLPPLLYDASWEISWKELWRWRRIVCSFAFVVVFLTATTVALVSNYFIPGFSLALGFLLGGIVSPPDAVSAGAILKLVHAPRRLSSILEGESLLNDASSLIVFRFALVAVATGQFIWADAILSFGWMVFGGAGIGLLLGFIFLKMHKWLPTDSNIDIILTLVAPYLMYITAEEFHSSGVLSVVAGGLFLSSRRYLFLNSSSRLQAHGVWQGFTFLLNGLVFMLIGLDLPEIVDGLNSEGTSMSDAISYTAIVVLVLIVGRMLSAYGAVVVTLIARNFIPVADKANPGWKGPAIIGWAGMRGVVSLAAALSIPSEIDGEPFPHRNLILFVTFGVILFTLVVQGLSLPFFLKKANLSDPDQLLPLREEDLLLQRELMLFSAAYLKDNYGEEALGNPYLCSLIEKWESKGNASEQEIISPRFREIHIEIIGQQRQWLFERNSSSHSANEELIRRQLTRLDLEEEKLRYI